MECEKVIDDFMTDYNFYSAGRDKELVEEIVDTLNKILIYDKKQEQPLILKITDVFIQNIAKRVVKEKNKSFLIGITGESASGKTVFVNNTTHACIKGDKSNFYTVVSQDDYYKDTSKELKEAGSYEELFKTGFSFDTPDVINLDLLKTHLLNLKSGQQITSPNDDFVTCESKPDGEVKNPAKVILTEGLYVLNENLRDIMDVKVYVYTPLEVLKERWYKRAASRGKTGEAADMQYKDVNSTAQKYIRPAQDISDVVINGLVSQEYIVEITDMIFNSIKALY